MDSRPSVVSVVVNYEGFEDTLKAVRSLLACRYPNHSIVVVDNASPSGDAARLEDELRDTVELVASDRNLGYGGGANLGIRLALERDAVFVWVLNNDVTIEPDCIDRLVDAMRREPMLGIASPQILAPEGPEAPAGVWFSGGRVLLGRAESRHLTERVSGDPVDSEYITGCAMFFRAEALRATGLFWEQWFLFW